LKPSEPTIAYCRIGERSSHTWFALKYLLGFENVRNYDGSWTEWGNLVNVPIENAIVEKLFRQNISMGKGMGLMSMVEAVRSLARAAARQP
jgi:hypothetical protein